MDQNNSPPLGKPNRKNERGPILELQVLYEYQYIYSKDRIDLNSLIERHQKSE